MKTEIGDGIYTRRLINKRIRVPWTNGLFQLWTGKVHDEPGTYFYFRK